MCGWSQSAPPQKRGSPFLSGTTLPKLAFGSPCHGNAHTGESVMFVICTALILPTAPSFTSFSRRRTTEL